jgi:hypothetical protein
MQMASNSFTGTFPQLYAAGAVNVSDIRISNTFLSGDVEQFGLLTSLTILQFSTTSISGDLVDLAPLVNCFSLFAHTSSIDAISGGFVNAGLTACRLENLTLTQAEVDTVLSNYVDVHNDVGLDLTKITS